MSRSKTNKSKSNYFGVSYIEVRKTGGASFMRLNDKYPWKANVSISGKRIICKAFLTELEAAKAVDMALINNGLSPRNILKPKP